MYFLLYAHNIPVAGEARSAIYDLQHANIVSVPNVLCRIIEELRHAPVRAVRRQYLGDDNGETFDKYLEFLQRKDLGFFTNEPEHFAPLALEYRQPATLTTAVLEYEWQHYDITSVINQLHNLLCKHLELRLWPGSLGTPAVEDLLQLTDDKCFRSITLFLQYHQDIGMKEMDQLYEQHPKLSHIFLLAAPFTATSTEWPGKVVCSQLDHNGLESAQLLQDQKYVVNMQYFTEALRHNTYFNGKLSVDRYGYVKNVLQQEENFGHASQLALKDIIASDAFRELWNAGVDKIRDINRSPLRYAMYIPRMLKCTGPDEYEIVNKTA